MEVQIPNNNNNININTSLAQNNVSINTSNLCFQCNKEPKISEKFSCNHILCELCLLKICLKFTKPNYDSDFIIYCTKCENGAFLNTNDFITDLMYEKNIIYKEQQCESCENLPSEIVCEDCQTQFCKKCFNFFHVINQAFNEHSISKKVFISDDNIDKILEPKATVPSTVLKSPKNRLSSLSGKDSRLSFLKERRRQMTNLQQKTENEEKMKKFNTLKNNEKLILYFRKLFNEFKETTRCFCALKNPVNFRCIDCDVKICEVCLLTIHKFHSVKFEQNTFNIESKYDDPKFLEMITQRSNDGSISPKNEIIKSFEKEKPKPSIHHSSVKALTKIEYDMRKESKLLIQSRPIEVIRTDEEYIEASILSKKLSELGEIIKICFENKMEKIEEFSKIIKNDISLINEFIGKKIKTNVGNVSNSNNSTNNGSTGNLVPRSSVTTNVSRKSQVRISTKGLSYHQKLAVDQHYKNRIKEEESNLDKLFSNLKSHLKEVLNFMESTEDSIRRRKTISFYNTASNMSLSKTYSKDKYEKNNISSEVVESSNKSINRASFQANSNNNIKVGSSNKENKEINSPSNNANTNNIISNNNNTNSNVNSNINNNSNPLSLNTRILNNAVNSSKIICNNISQNNKYYQTNFSLEKISELKEDINNLSSDILKKENNLLNIFFGHISNNPYISEYNHNNIGENLLVHDFDNLDFENTDQDLIMNKKPLRKRTLKNLRESGITPTCDLLKLTGYSITSSSNMSKDSFPNMMTVFQTSMNRDFLTYINNVNYEIIVLEFNPEFKYKNESLKKMFLNNKIKLRGHLSNINCLKYYFFKTRDILFSCSEDGTIKGWDCSDFRLEMNIAFGDSGSEPVYSLNMITLQEENYLLIGAYSKNSPIKIYNNLQGIIQRYLPINGYTYHIDSYVDENNDCRFIFVSVINSNKYEVLLFDFGTGEKIFKFSTNYYVHSFFMFYNNDNNLILTIADRMGTVYQYNFSDYKPIKIIEKSGFGYYGLIKWNSKYFISIGKEASMDIINSETLSIEKSYKLAHEDSIRNLCQFRHSYFGYVIFTYGEDQRIKMFK